MDCDRPSFGPNRNSPGRNTALLVDTGLTLWASAISAADSGCSRRSGEDDPRTPRRSHLYRHCGGWRIHQHLCFSGATPNPFSAPLLPHAAEIYSLHELGADFCRYDDIHDNAAALRHPLWTRQGHSFSRVPICSEDGEVLGRILARAPQPGTFSASMEHPLHLLFARWLLVLRMRALPSTLPRDRPDRPRTRLQRETADRLSLPSKQRSSAHGRGPRDRSAGTWMSAPQRLFFAEPHTPLSRSMMRDRIVNPEDRAITFENLQASLNSGRSTTQSTVSRTPGKAGSLRRPPLDRCQRHSYLSRRTPRAQPG